MSFGVYGVIKAAMSNPYLYMTLIGLIVKIWAAYRLRQNISVPGARLCMAFLAVAYAQTVLELYGFYLLEYPGQNTVLLLKLYYVSVATILILLPLLLNVLIHQYFELQLGVISVIVWAVIALLILNTDTIIAGARPLAFAITRIEGEYYWIFRVFSLTLLTMTLLSLLRAYRVADNEISRAKSANFLIGFIPLICTLFLIVVLMKLGVPITAAGSLPLLLSIIILVMAENIRSDCIFDLRVFIPWSKKAQRIRQITRPLSIVSMQAETAKHSVNEYDKALIDTAVEMFSTQQAAAAWLGVSKSKMSRKIKKKSESVKTND